MKHALKRAAYAALAASAVVGGLLTSGAGAALAGTTPPWEPDPNTGTVNGNTYGNLVFYDSAGHVLTGGSSLTHLFDYAAASTNVTGDSKATLYFANPTPGVATGSWPTASASVSSPYPNSAAPAPVTGPGFPNPLVSLGSTDGNLSNFIASHTVNTTTGYANVYQVRLVTSGAGGVSTANGPYWATDIQVNPSAGTWTVLYPSVTTTATTLTASPASPQSTTGTTGSDITLTGTVAPAENGTISFYNGSALLGSSAVTTTNGQAAYVVTSPAVGSYSFTAKFVPTGGTLVQDSMSSAVPYTIGQQYPTTTSLSINPTSQAQYSNVTFTSDVKDHTGAPYSSTGSVDFVATGPGTSTAATDLGKVSTQDGTVGEYQLAVNQITLSPGSYNVVATFTPTSTTDLSSSSPAVALTITAPACQGTTNPPPGSPTNPSCNDQQNIQVTVNPGTLTITTPYTATSPYTLPAMQLNSAGTLLSTSAQFPLSTDPQIVVQSSLAGDPNWTVSVTASDLSDGKGHTISGAGLGLTAGHQNATPAFPATVTFTAIPALDPNGPTADGSIGPGPGLKGGPHTFAASSGGGNGSASMYGTLTLLAPTSTVAGTYTGTITFAVA